MDPIEIENLHDDGSEDLPVLVRLTGDFDVRYQQVLEGILDDCVASGRFALIDLSMVTFMDSRCIRELAIQYLLSDGRVVLCDPSREVALSVAACDLEDCLDFFCTTRGADAEYRTGGHLRLVRGEELAGDREGVARHESWRVSSMGLSRRGATGAAAVPRSVNGEPRDGRILVTGVKTSS